MTDLHTIRTVLDDTPLINPHYCLRETANPRRRCCLLRGHKGTCLPLATPWPRRGAA